MEATANQDEVGEQPIRAPLQANWRLFGAVVFFYTLLIPLPFNFSVGTLLLPPYRVFLLAAVLPIMLDLMRGRLRLGLIDLVVGLFAFWLVVSSIWTMGFDRALQASGALTVDIAIAYLWIRATLSNLQQVRFFLIMIAPGLVATGLLIAIESITKTYIAIPIATAITGQAHDVSPALRLGLMRAQGPFPHPILAGVFLGSLLPLYLLSGLRGWPIWAGAIGSLCCIFTLSSGAFLVLAAGLGLILANWVVERTSFISWRLVLGTLFAIVFFLEVATESGVVRLITRFAALNNQTAFFRLLIWEEGVKTVQEFPLFGIGFNDWNRPSWMPPSVDNYWLVLAMRHGVLAPITSLLAVAAALFVLAKRSVFLELVDQRMIRGVAISLAVTCLSVFSVALWLSPQVWLFALLAIAVSAGQGGSAADIVSKPAKMPSVASPSQS